MLKRFKNLKSLRKWYFSEKDLLFAAEGDSGKRARPEVPNHNEEPGQEICHSGAGASDDDYDEDDDDNHVDDGD